MDTVLGVLWFLAPAGIANMMAPIAAKFIPSASWPIDGGRRFRGQPLFGQHKTWRGIAAAVMGGYLSFLLQQRLYRYAFVQQFSLFNYVEAPATLGVLLGAGAIIGDLAESFIKRRRGLRPGVAWFPFDQIDWYIGAMLAASVHYTLTGLAFMVGLFAALALSLVVKRIGVRLGIDAADVTRPT